MDTSTFGTLKILGLGRPDAELHSFAYAGIDASKVFGLSVPSRLITLDIHTQNDYQRMRLYRALPYGQVRRFWFGNDTGVYWIDGYATELPYDEVGHEISSFEIPIFCPYPWFRRAGQHELEIAADAAKTVHLTQSGDVPAGIRIYAQGTFNQLGALESFRLSNRISGGDYFEAKTDNRLVASIPGIFRNLLLDTTPGADSMGLEGTFSAEFLSSVDMSANLITVDPENGTDLVFTASSSTCQFFACWYDTFTAI